MGDSGTVGSSLKKHHHGCLLCVFLCGFILVSEVAPNSPQLASSSASASPHNVKWGRTQHLKEHKAQGSNMD